MSYLTDLFELKTGSLPALEKTEEGDIPLVYGTTKNNGIKKFVKVDDPDQIFEPPLITVSYLGTAFVQVVPFTTSVVDKSNIIVLVPKRIMSLEEMYYFCYQINRIARFGFHYGRRMNMRQLKKTRLLSFQSKCVPAISFKNILPKEDKSKTTLTTTSKFPEFIMTFFKLTDVFTIVRGRGAYREDTSSGKTPLISATSLDNGVLDYVNLQPIFKAPALTVERVSGQTFVQLHDFVTVPADISVLIPKKPVPLSLLFLIASIMNLERWSFSFGRKLTAGRLKRMRIPIPVNQKGEIDTNLSEELIAQCFGWSTIRRAVTQKNKNQFATLDRFS